MAEVAIVMPVIFYLNGNEDFWEKAHIAAAQIDHDNGNGQSTYSQAQIFTVLWHHDGYATLEEIAKSVGECAALEGWCSDMPWADLGEIGKTYSIKIDLEG